MRRTIQRRPEDTLNMKTLLLELKRTGNGRGPTLSGDLWKRRFIESVEDDGLPADVNNFDFTRLKTLNL